MRSAARNGRAWRRPHSPAPGPGRGGSLRWGRRRRRGRRASSVTVRRGKTNQEGEDAGRAVREGRRRPGRKRRKRHRCPTGHAPPLDSTRMVSVPFLGSIPGSFGVFQAFKRSIRFLGISSCTPSVSILAGRGVVRHSRYVSLLSPGLIAHRKLHQTPRRSQCSPSSFMI